jgi:hypothetical protein
MPINFNKSLRNWAFVTTNKIRNRIIETDTIDTGDLLASIKYIQSGNFIQFSMLDYGKYTDNPNPRVKKTPRPPRNFYNKVIDDMGDELEDYLLKDVELEIEKALEKSGKLKD